MCDYTDLDWVVRELTRMRARGSRAFLISAVPTNGIPHFHSSFDKVWSAAEDLGMIAILHVGANPATFAPGWTNVEGDMTLLRQLGISQGHQSVQVFLNGMVFGGVFERHPNLTVLIAECGLHWFSGTFEHMEQRNSTHTVSPGVFFGEYRWSLSPTEFAHRNVRVSPLPTPHQSPARLLDEYPECAVFCSDYAHNEGHPSPVAYYDDLLQTRPNRRAVLRREHRRRCFGAWATDRDRLSRNRPDDLTPRCCGALLQPSIAAEKRTSHGPPTPTGDRSSGRWSSTRSRGSPPTTASRGSTALRVGHELRDLAALRARSSCGVGDVVGDEHAARGCRSCRASAAAPPASRAARRRL